MKPVCTVSSPGRGWLASLAAVGLGVVGLQAQSMSGRVPLKLGVVLPPNEPEATSILRGVQLGAGLMQAEIGRAVELIVRGSPGQWGTEGDDAVALALDAGVQALIAPASGATVHLVEQVAGRARIPTAALCGDASVTGARLPWVLRLVPGSNQEARALFAGARTAEGRPMRRWAALVPEGRAGREATKDLTDAAKAADCTLDPVLPAAASPTNARPVLERLTRTAPAGLLVWLDPQAAGRWVRALRAAGFTGVVAGPGRLVGPTFLEAAGPAAEGFYSARPAMSEADWAKAEQFTTAFSARFGVAPDPLAAAAADALRVLTTVLHEAGEQPAFTFMPPRRPLEGFTGQLEFDTVGNRRVNLEVVVAGGQRFGPPPSGDRPVKVSPGPMAR